jgi:hypothetical protein
MDVLLRWAGPDPQIAGASPLGIDPGPDQAELDRLIAAAKEARHEDSG